MACLSSVSKCGTLIFVVLLALNKCNCKTIPRYIDLLYDPDMDRNVSLLISSKGYPVEDHYVQTKDGFILSMQRIPHGKVNKNTGPKDVVFLQHGLLSASSDWVINFPNQSLGFILADAGYDVWMGNVRGNTYSRRNVNYTPDRKEFWNFSFDEIAERDLPAMIDYILNSTGQKDLFYVGHSQGTTVAFALLSEKPEYNEKIRLFVALAPVATVGYITSAISYLAPFTSEVHFLFKLLGVNEFLPNDELMKLLSEFVCDTRERFICEDIMFLFFGTDLKELNETRMAVYSAHTPAGTSTKSIVHFAQMVNSKKFLKYDYGKKGNQLNYNQPTPPEYDVLKITTPVALIWSLNDKLADPTDVGLLQKKLRSIVSSSCVSFPLFNHGDFVLAVDAPKLVYNEVLGLFQRFS
ncbi:Gastric triacylglycerol lipase, partial [Stegodyphus mimosarum]